MYVFRSEDNLWELILSFLVVPRDQTQVVRHGDKCFYWLSYLAGPKFLCI